MSHENSFTAMSPRGAGRFLRAPTVGPLATVRLKVQYDVVCCIVLQCVAVFYSVLQCVVVYYSVLQHIFPRGSGRFLRVPIVGP